MEGWEGLMAAQECLPTNKEKDAFGADYRVLNRAWDAVSPDPFLATYKADYLWLTRVYESVKPTDGRGSLIWAALGAKTIELCMRTSLSRLCMMIWIFLRWMPM